MKKWGKAVRWSICIKMKIFCTDVIKTKYYWKCRSTVRVTGCSLSRHPVVTLHAQPCKDKQVTQPFRNFTLSRITQRLKASDAELFQCQHWRDNVTESSLLWFQSYPGSCLVNAPLWVCLHLQNSIILIISSLLCFSDLHQFC